MMIEFIMNNKLMKCGISFLLLSLTLTTSQIRCAAQGTSPIVQTVVANQSAFFEKVKSLSAHIQDIKVQYRDSDGNPITTTTSNEFFDWARAGQYVAISQTVPSQGYHPQLTMMVYYDGTHTFDLFKQPFRSDPNATYGNFRNRWSRLDLLIWPFTPLDLGYEWPVSAGKKISDLLSSANSTQVTTSVDPKFGPLDIIQIPANNGGSISFSFAEKYGYAAVKYEVRIPAESNIRSEEYASDDYEKIDGVWIAKGGTESNYIIVGANKTLLARHTLQFTDIQVNKQTKSDFTPKLVAGTVLNNPDDLTRFVVQPDGSWKQVKSMYSITTGPYKASWSINASEYMLAAGLLLVLITAIWRLRSKNSL
jgi:hypothetical protein